MKKIKTLIKVSLSHDMNIFKINTKKQGKFTKIILPLIFTFYIMMLVGTYSQKVLDLLKPMHLEFITLTLFALSVSIITIIEGVYKSGSLLFNCKDDDLLLSLPIKKSTVLFIRMFKFYIFELIYNTLFILPAIVVYGINVPHSWTYYLTSFIALFILPIVPIALSCVIGFIIIFLSSKFKGKNIFQTIFTMILLLVIMYFSFNSQNIATNIIEKASSINDLITRLYYPVGAYISLINEFSIRTLLIFIISHLIIASITIYVLGKVYFKTNSSSKRVLISHKNSKYVVKSNSKMISFIKKELSKFISTPVFITNAGLGLVLFIIACLAATLKFDSVAETLVNVVPSTNIENIKTYLPTIMFALVAFTSFMTSITSSMISLEGKSFSILKSLPLKPTEIVMYKVLTALIIMIPCIIIGDIIIFIRFKFDLISIILILISSIILPIVSELIGIIVNLKYPKIDATNDTEVVKQSMSALAATFIGMGLLGIASISLIIMLNAGIENNNIMLILTTAYGIIATGLWIFLVKTCDKNFNNITA